MIMQESAGTYSAVSDSNIYNFFFGIIIQPYFKIFFTKNIYFYILNSLENKIDLLKNEDNV